MVESARWRWSDASSGRCEEALEERAGRLGAGGERIMVSERGGREGVDTRLAERWGGMKDGRSRAKSRDERRAKEERNAGLT